MINKYRWFCHVDDDTYLNINRLNDVLSQYDADKLWYLGRKSTDHKVVASYKNVRSKS